MVSHDETFGDDPQSTDPQSTDPQSTDPLLGPSGRPFPTEHEWLDLPVPTGEDAVSVDFVIRTLTALSFDRGSPRAADDTSTANGTTDDAVTPQILAAFLAPEPSPDFVVRTLMAIKQDQRARWRELLARYDAPEPSPLFVARTLAALATEPLVGEPKATGGAPSSPVPGRRDHRVGPRLWAWPMLALAAAALFWFTLAPTNRAPFELRLVQRESPAFAHAYAATPLAAVLTATARKADPDALPLGGADGQWLLLGVDR